MGKCRASDCWSSSSTCSNGHLPPTSSTRWFRTQATYLYRKILFTFGFSRKATVGQLNARYHGQRPHMTLHNRAHMTPVPLPARLGALHVSRVSSYAYPLPAPLPPQHTYRYALTVSLPFLCPVPSLHGQRAGPDHREHGVVVRAGAGEPLGRSRQLPWPAPLAGLKVSLEPNLVPSHKALCKVRALVLSLLPTPEAHYVPCVG